MTLLETINLIKGIANSQPNINTILDDIYDLNTDNVDAVYSAFCVQQEQHNISENSITYNFVIFYVDRLLSDKSNKIEVQSTGIQVLTNIIKALDTYEFFDVEASTFQVFTQRFEAECAGVYSRLGITVPTPDCVRYVPNEDSFNDDYNNDYN